MSEADGKYPTFQSLEQLPSSHLEAVVADFTRYINGMNTMIGPMPALPAVSHQSYLAASNELHRRRVAELLNAGARS